MANDGYKAQGVHEEKAHSTNAQAQSRSVNASSRPNHGASSRFTQNYQSSRGGYDELRSHRHRSRSPYRPDRQRSRSPYRASRDGQNGKRRHNEDHYSSSASGTRRTKIHHANDRGGRQEEQEESPPQWRGRDAYLHRERSRSPFRRLKNDIRRASAQGSITSVGSHDANKQQQAVPETEPDQEPEVKLSDAEIIEQRRKKREAIKAKYKAQPLLQQALEQNMTSAPNTPMHESSAASFTAHSPTSLDSPAADSPASAPFSPVSFTADNMDDIINHIDADPADQGPAAADYDPTMDMQEDRRDLPQPESKPKKKEVDMFADDDEYDMFADGDAPKAADIAKTAKTLDKSLLDNWDYPDGHYRVIVGELLDNKYAVQQQIGKGTFATVIRAQDMSTGAAVAVKIACNNDTMYKAGTKELEFLTILNDTDPDDKRHIIRLLGRFDHKGHMCLVFEHLQADLRETLKKYGRNVGINLTALRSFAYQMFLALLHMQKNEILHADLKPDNILVSEKLSLLKICDLGTASKIQDQEITPYLVSRYYRAPEVMLGIPFDYAIDMWSIGCTLFELHSGRILFAGADNNQMLRVIQECRGKIPNRMLKKATQRDSHFDEHGNFFSIERDKLTGHVNLRWPNLLKIAAGKDLRTRIMASAKDTGPSVIKEVQSFIDLVEKCLALDPARRITPAEALRHPFITRVDKTAKFTALAPKKNSENDYELNANEAIQALTTTTS